MPPDRSPDDLSGLFGQSEDGWREYRRLILAELERINKSIIEINKKMEQFRADEISQIKVAIAMLQVKSGVWGAAAGLAVAIGAALLKYVAGH
jgi:hypothetical protein